jgi:hypothetical protein
MSRSINVNGAALFRNVGVLRNTLRERLFKEPVQGPAAGCCRDGNELSPSTKEVCDYYLIRAVSYSSS